MQTVLVVDDDAHIRDVVCFALKQGGFKTTEAADGTAALIAFKRTRPDLVVLDILMPEMDGMEVCRQIRGEGNVPIIFLSSKDAESDRIDGLDTGADDYVTKPFSPRELVARVRAQLRRVAAPPEPDVRFIDEGPLHIDLEKRMVLVTGQPVDLTRTEFGLLTTLARRPGKVFDRDALMDGAYIGNRIVSGRTIDSHVRRLRAKLRAAGCDAIHTAHGVGYRLSFP